MTSATCIESPAGVGLPSLVAGPRAAPVDRALPGLDRLFDAEWVWQAFCDRFGWPEETPDRLRLKHFQYRPGKRALVAYVAERQWGRWVVEDQFACELVAGKEERLFRYPDDPYLPGLSAAAAALEAHDLLPKYVRLHPHRLYVEAVRYRPGTRAVLRYSARWRNRSAGEVTLYVRVLPPNRLPQLLTAGELAERSGFAVPRLLGCWREGGVAWLAKMPGEPLRTLIRRGTPPEADRILDGLAPLWAVSALANSGQPLDVGGAYRWTERVLAGVLPDGAAHAALSHATSALRPFAEAWRPSALAHNDFYDDQLIVAPEGRIALVDFEEIGPGDPMMDVGTMLAHLRWMARLGGALEPFDAYRGELRSSALERFGWEPRELALREAFALFRLATNPLRRMQGDWLATVESALGLVTETLGDAA